MRFIMELKDGRKGIKIFETIQDYTDFLTKHNDKIVKLVEAETPYMDKPVKLPKVSSTKGWDTVDSSAFGDVLGTGEKGESLMSGDCKDSIVKDDAQFSISKPSEKEDKFEAPKSPKGAGVATKTDGENSFKEFKYTSSTSSSTSSDKSENKDSDKEDDSDESKKEDKKEQVDESVFDDMDKDIDDFNKASDEFIKSQKKKQDCKKDCEKCDEKEQINEDFINPLFGDELDEMLNEYLVYTFMDIFNMVSYENNQTYQYIVLKLLKSDRRMKPFINKVRNWIANNTGGNERPIDTYHRFVQLLRNSGIDENILSKATQTFEQEDCEKCDDELDEDFKSGLKKAGKYAKGAIAGAAMAGAVASNAQGMEDPYYDGAQRPYEDSYEQVQDYEKPQIKSVKPDGTIIDQYGNEFTKEQWKDLMNGKDPFAESWDAEIAESLRNAGVELDEVEELTPSAEKKSSYKPQKLSNQKVIFQKVADKMWEYCKENNILDGTDDYFYDGSPVNDTDRVANFENWFENLDDSDIAEWFYEIDDSYANDEDTSFVQSFKQFVDKGLEKYFGTFDDRLNS